MCEIALRMKPNPAAPVSFKYQYGKLLPLQGVMEEDELCCPKLLDAHGERCLIVIKNGCTTDVTIGRATGAKSFVREYFPDGTQLTSIEWAILPYGQKSGAFSAPGDSGAIIVDSNVRIGSPHRRCGQHRGQRHHVHVAFSLALTPYQGPLPQRRPLPANGLGVAISIQKTSATYVEVTPLLAFECY